jgi:hypothetical protein
MLQQIPNGKHAGELAAGVDDGQVAHVALHHVDQGIFLVAFVGDGFDRGSHDITHASVAGMAMTQHHAQHHVTLREDAEQLAAVNHGNCAHGVLSHDFHGFEHG